MKDWIISLLMPREIGRISFLIRLLTLFGIFAFIAVAIALPPPEEEGYRNWLILGIPFAIYNLLFITMPRIRHIGLPTWTIILALVPYLNGGFLVFLVIVPRRRTFLATTLGVSPAPLNTDSQTDEAKEEHPPTSVAGSNCEVCDEFLMLAMDGSISEEGKVICNDCLNHS